MSWKWKSRRRKPGGLEGQGSLGVGQDMAAGLDAVPGTEFNGYDNFDSEARVLHILMDGVQADTAQEGDETALISTGRRFTPKAAAGRRYRHDKDKDRLPQGE